MLVSCAAAFSSGSLMNLKASAVHHSHRCRHASARVSWFSSSLSGGELLLERSSFPDRLSRATSADLDPISAPHGTSGLDGSEAYQVPARSI